MFSVHVFAANSSEVIYEHHQVSGRAVLSGLFVPHQVHSPPYHSTQLQWQNQSQLYFINKQQVYILLLAFYRIRMQSRLDIKPHDFIKAGFTRFH